MSELDCLNLEESIVTDLGHASMLKWNPLMNADEMRRQAALAMLSRCTIGAVDVSQLLDDAAALAAKTLETDRYGVARLQGGELTTAFHFGSTASWGEASGKMNHELSLEAQQSATAFSISTNRPVVISNLAHEYRFQDEILQRHKVVSAVICPLSFTDRVFGTIGVYSTTPRSFSCEEGLFVAEMAQQLGSAIARQLNEAALEQQTRYIDSLEGSSTCLLVTLSPDGSVVRFNRIFQETFGFDIEEVNNRHFWSAFLLPEDVTLAKEGFSRLRQGESPVDFETFVLTKHGETRRVAWSFMPLLDGENNLESLIGTGSDVTELFETLENLQRAEYTAEESRLAIDELKKKLDGDEGILPDLAGMNDAKAAPESDQFDDRRKQDRRTRRRCPFPYMQSIAPLVDGQLPTLRQYEEIRCHDISPGGFSFLLDHPPQHKEYVISFGSGAQKMYLTAKVAHVAIIEVDGQEMHKVGCQYTGRASY